MAKHHGMKGHKAHHHGKKAAGGAALPKNDIYAGEHSNVVKEAEEKKRGGGTEHHVGEKMKSHRGRPGRKRGGGVGSNLHPLSTAATIKNADGHKATEGKADGVRP